MWFQIKRWVHRFLFFIVAVSLGVGLFGCALKPATPTPPVAMLYLLEVRDKDTGLAVPRNEMILRRETPEGEPISTTVFENQTRFAIQIPADGSQRVFIEITAAGYLPWRDNYRIFNMPDSYLEFTAELEKAP